GRARDARGPVPRRGRARRLAADRVRDRVPAGLPREPAPAPARRGAPGGDGRGLDRARARLDRALAHGRVADARARRRAGAVGVPGGGHGRRCEVRGTRLPREREGVSYTLRGRLGTRLAAVLVRLVAAVAFAFAADSWWPLELAAVMAGVGLAADVLVYDRLLDYQPGWLALPLGAAELGVVVGVAKLAGIMAPLGSALA